MHKILRILGATLTAGLLVAFANPAAAADAKAIWSKDCAKCHGPDGKGDTKTGKKLKAQDFTKADWQKKTTDADIASAIKDGKGTPDEDGEKPMPAYPKLSADDVKALTAYIRSFK